jgi:hypothetical protein
MVADHKLLDAMSGGPVYLYAILWKWGSFREQCNKEHKRLANHT